MTEAVTEPEQETAMEEPEAAPPAAMSHRLGWCRLGPAGEVVAIVLLAWLAVWCWNRGVVRLAYPIIEGQQPLISTRYHGNWLGTAVGAATLALLLALDAVRQIMLAVRARPQKAADSDM